MADKKAQNADVKEITAPDQLAASQKLAGLTSPGELAAVKSCPTAEKKTDHAQVRVKPEQELVEPIHAAYL